jgi:hypothetical protein
MSHQISGTPTSKATNDFTQMVGELRKKVDTNADGSVSSAEFAQFLTKLMEHTDRADRTAAVNPAASPLAPLAPQAPLTVEARAIDAPAKLQAAALAALLRKG